VAGLSRILRDFLGEKIFGPKWAERVDDLGARRADWVAQKLPFEDLKSRVENYVDDKGWLK
jgi:precorrin-2 dehydrogenase/sirohydrochlorin ferrochelatase